MPPRSNDGKAAAKSAARKKNKNNKKAPSRPVRRPATKARAAKPIGSSRSRRRVREITKRVLAYCQGATPTEAAPILGVSVDDMRNMRQGNKLSVPILLKMVRVGRFDPKSIIEGPKLRKLPSKRSVRGAQQRLLDGRIRKLSWTRPGKEWAKLTGLSVTGAYGLRYATGAHVTLYTVLGFLDAGHGIDELVFGS